MICPGKVFYGGTLTSKTSGIVDVGPANGDAANLDLIPSVCGYKESNQGPEWENLSNFGSPKISKFTDFTTFLGLNPSCLMSPHFLSHLSSPKSTQMDSNSRNSHGKLLGWVPPGNAQKRQDSEYETWLDKKPIKFCWASWIKRVRFVGFLGFSIVFFGVEKRMCFWKVWDGTVEVNFEIGSLKTWRYV